MTKAQLMEKGVSVDTLGFVADYIQSNPNSCYVGTDATGLVNNEGFLRGWIAAGTFLRTAADPQGSEKTPPKPPYTESQHPEKKTTPAQ